MDTDSWDRFAQWVRTQAPAANSQLPVSLGDTDGFEVGLAGESRYQEELSRIRGENKNYGPEGERVYFDARLSLEPDNPVDSSAVRVDSHRGTVGYLSRKTAQRYAQVFSLLGTHGRIGVCRATAVGGTTAKPLIGVWISLDPAEELLEVLSADLDPATGRRPVDDEAPRGQTLMRATLPDTQSTREAQLDPHGQPFNLRFNRARRAERDLSEFLGMAKGLVADGVVTEEEARYVAEWVLSHPDASEQWPFPAVIERLNRIYADQRVDEGERRDLASLLESIVGGTAGLIVGRDAPTELPLDAPPPVLTWTGAVYVFTGQFAYGTRANCEREVLRRGGTCEDRVTKKTRYLVIGTFGSRDWVHTSLGRKIQKAVYYRSKGQPLAIVCEDHWGAAIMGAAQ
jgi:hypothetical protein